MFKTEKQFTERASKLIYEEVYFNSCMTEDNYDSASGFRLKYPELFSANNSQDKSIAPRKIRIIPSAHQLKFDITIPTQIAPDIFSIQIDVTPENTTQEVLNEMKRQLKEQTEDYDLIYDYDTMSGHLNLTINNGVPFFYLDFSNDSDEEQLWKFFNQSSNPGFGQANATINIIELDNVWNRDYLYVHASFSNSRYHYLCTSNDDWESPSKLFYDNVFGYDFFVYFTTNGITKIIPYYANKLIELSFVLRTQKL